MELIKLPANVYPETHESPISLAHRSLLMLQPWPGLHTPACWCPNIQVEENVFARLKQLGLNKTIYFVQTPAWSQLHIHPFKTGSVLDEGAPDGSLCPPPTETIVFSC
ncbi:hypothetical protein PGTUg99_005504 [Puccinia graminis f. sp. tritici]|uniref:Uncharacterized protein n=1 Tax=Puccinia graminis f. sp. tritici TaxID=56615 RepID=A0A5B0NRH2_PUCGR|nr:hypothetical protein PGTUg99_005504 [Puccinia graminis f. sp. tritici]